MNKIFKKVLLLSALLLIPLSSTYAQTSAPQFINFQGVLVDEGGNTK